VKVTQTVNHKKHTATYILVKMNLTSNIMWYFQLC